MNWTESKIKELKELWEQGTMAKDIAKTFGTSKNSVIAKANRLNCTPRKRGGATYVRRSHDVPKEEPKEIPEHAIAEPENPTLLSEIANNQCKFPKWDKEDPYYCCGRNQWKNYSYCMYHVYISTKKEKT